MKQEIEQQLRRYENYLRQDPQNAKLVAETALLYSRLGRHSEALSLLEEPEATLPSDPQLAFTRATVLISSHHPREAAEILANLLEQGIDNPGVRYNMAYARALGGDMEAAGEVLDPAFEDVRQAIPEASVLHARIRHHLGDPESAIQLTKDFLASYPAHPMAGEAEGVLALAALDNEDREDAKTHAQKALAHNQGNHESLITLGSLALDELDPETANSYFQAAIERQPDSGRGWLGIGLLKMLNRDFVNAENALKKCVELMPSHLGSWNTLAWCQIIQNKIDDAERTLQQSLEVNRNFSETHGGLAVIAVLRNQPDAAEQHIKRAIGLNPNGFSGQFARSLLLSGGGDTAKAQRIISDMMQTPMGKEQRTLAQSLQRFAARNRGGQKGH